MKQLWCICLCIGLCIVSFAQQITGVWHGKVGTAIGGVNVELKLVQKGDSLVGTSYYYRSKNNWTRYSVKGYFNQHTNAVIWWDDKLIESKHPTMKLLPTDQTMLLVEANFDCPNGGTMRLEGEGEREGKDKKVDIDFQKKGSTQFEDEWDIVLDNWLVGGNNKYLIDSIQGIAFNKPEYMPSTPITESNTPITYKTDTINNIVATTIDLPVKKPIAVVPEKPVGQKPPLEFLDLNKQNKKEVAETTKRSEQLELTPIFGGNTTTSGVTFDNFKIDSTKKDDVINTRVVNAKESQDPPLGGRGAIKDKFVTRQKVILAELPLADSIELHFYDNAEVDGDSISLFLNNKLLLEHIRLTDKPYIVKLHKEQLAEATELTMVAENLGSIPPNTSYMVAYVNKERFTATLSSTEQTSAVIKFKKPEK